MKYYGYYLHIVPGAKDQHGVATDFPSIMEKMNREISVNLNSLKYLTPEDFEKGKEIFVNEDIQLLVRVVYSFSEEDADRKICMDDYDHEEYCDCCR